MYALQSRLPSKISSFEIHSITKIKFSSISSWPAICAIHSNCLNRCIFQSENRKENKTEDEGMLYVKKNAENLSLKKRKFEMRIMLPWQWTNTLHNQCFFLPSIQRFTVRVSTFLRPKCSANDTFRWNVCCAFWRFGSLEKSYDSFVSCVWHWLFVSSTFPRDPGVKPSPPKRVSCEKGGISSNYLGVLLSPVASGTRGGTRCPF